MNLWDWNSVICLRMFWKWRENGKKKRWNSSSKTLNLLHKTFIHFSGNSVKEIVTTPRWINRLTLVFQISFIGCTFSYEINIPFLSRTCNSWILKGFVLAVKIIASVLTQRGDWVPLAMITVFSPFQLLFESVHRLTHWTQHTCYGVLHTHTQIVRAQSITVAAACTSPQQQYDTEEYAERGNQSVSSSSAEESKFDFVSQFHFPLEVTRGHSSSHHRGCDNHLVQHLSHFLGQKHLS